MRFLQGIGTGVFVAAAFVLLAQVSGVFADEPAPVENRALVAETFMYQGRLEIDGVPANGTFDFEFYTYTSEQLETFAAPDVPVTNGVFSVPITFAPGVISGEELALNVTVRPGDSSGDFTDLGSQVLRATPYALYARTAGSLTVDGYRMFRSIDTTSLFLGFRAGEDTIGPDNTFVGHLAGVFAHSGESNTFVGDSSGRDMETGSYNSFFGSESGLHGFDGNHNAAFGYRSGRNLTSGSQNVFFGSGAGAQTNAGDANVFLGYEAGLGIVGGSHNVAIGNQANVNGPNRQYATAIGAEAVALDSSQVQLGRDGIDTVRIGRTSGLGSRTLCLNATNVLAECSTIEVDAGQAFSLANAGIYVGNAGNAESTGFGNVAIGPASGQLIEDGSFNVFAGYAAGAGTTTGGDNVFIGTDTGDTNTTGGNNTAIGRNADVGANNFTFATAIGSDAVAASSDQVQLGRDTIDTVRIGKLDTSGSATQVCITASNVLATCTSSLRYKANIDAYTGGLDLVRQLQPVTFDWKSDGSHDLGFVAEDVAAIDPLLAIYRDGEVDGVKYDRLSAILVNGMNEQQDQIDALASGIAPADDPRLSAIEARLEDGNGFGWSMLAGIALLAGLVGSAVGISATTALGRRRTD